MNFPMSKGFSTLYIVIILGGICLGTALALSVGTAWSIRAGDAWQASMKAKALTNGCVEAALETIRENNAFAGTADLTIGGGSCRYVVAVTGARTRSIDASSTYAGATRKAHVETNAFEPLTVSSWQEVP